MIYNVRAANVVFWRKSAKYMITKTVPLLNYIQYSQAGITRNATLDKNFPA